MRRSTVRSLVVAFGMLLASNVQAEEVCQLAELKNANNLPDFLNFTPGQAHVAVGERFQCNFPRPDVVDDTPTASVDVSGAGGSRSISVLAFFAGLGDGGGDLSVKMDLVEPDSFSLGELGDFATISTAFGTDYLYVEFGSNPSGAELWLKEQRIGSTAAIVALREGILGEVAMRLSGYDDCPVKNVISDGSGFNRHVYCELTPSAAVKRAL
mgnify:FL=1